MADTAGRQMGLPLYAVLKGKTMNIMSLLNALPGAVAQGLIWGIMAIGVYITFRILDFADLTVDGSLCTGGAVCIMMMLNGQNVWVAMFAALLAGMAAGCCLSATGFFGIKRMICRFAASMPPSRKIAAMTASNASARIDERERPPVCSSPLPSRRNSPR